ncbi:torsin-1A-like [Polymixia lowei]
MKTTYKTVLLHVLMTGVVVNAFDPVTTVCAVGVALLAAGYIVSNERCDSSWITFNPRLKSDLEDQLFGQHIASHIVLKAVTGFMDSNAKKPLVLSFHGASGTGKNFVSQLIAKNLFRKGTNSRFFHLFISDLHFPHQSQIGTYKSQLQQWIKGNVTNCENSMFVFDEMDKMHPGIIDSITPYLDYNDKVDGVSYRKAIFIFLSNAGGESIANMALDFWREGRKREEIELKDLQQSLSLSAFNNNQHGLWRTNLIEKNLVDVFVPFLPLEKQHVVQCILAEMVAKDLSPNVHMAKKVADELIYFPKSEKLFSAKGCKGLRSHIDLYL